MHLIGPLFSGSSMACRGGSQEADRFQSSEDDDIVRAFKIRRSHPGK